MGHHETQGLELDSPSGNLVISYRPIEIVSNSKIALSARRIICFATRWKLKFHGHMRLALTLHGDVVAERDLRHKGKYRAKPGARHARDFNQVLTVDRRSTKISYTRLVFRIRAYGKLREHGDFE